MELSRLFMSATTYQSFKDEGALISIAPWSLVAQGKVFICPVQSIACSSLVGEVIQNMYFLLSKSK